MMSHVSRPNREILQPGVLTSPVPPMIVTTPWDYQLYLQSGPLDQINERYFNG